MTSAYFPTVKSWALPRSAFAASLRELARDGRNGTEGIALWLGNRAAGIATITHVVCLRGSAVDRQPDYLQLTASTLNDVADLAIENRLSIVGQIHSHGSYAGVDLSAVDRRSGIAVPHFLSVVAPDYALRPNIRIEECGVHVFETGSGYRRFRVEETTARVHILEDLDSAVLFAGTEGP